MNSIIREGVSIGRQGGVRNLHTEAHSFKEGSWLARASVAKPMGGAPDQPPDLPPEPPLPQ